MPSTWCQESRRTSQCHGVEVAEARFFPLDALPPGTSGAALRRISEHRGEREADGTW